MPVWLNSNYETGGQFTFWFQTTFSSNLLSYPLDRSCPSPVSLSSNHPRLLSVLQIEYSLSHLWSFGNPSSRKTLPLSSNPLDHLSKLWLSTSNSDVKSSTSTHMVQQLDQNLLCFPLCFYSPLVITLSWLWNRLIAFTVITFHLFNIRSFIQKVLIECYFSPDVGMYQLRKKKKKQSPLSSHGL